MDKRQPYPSAGSELVVLVLVALVAASACNYIAPFDPEDQPLRPSTLLEDGDHDGGFNGNGDSDIDGDADNEPCQPNCERRSCGPDGCGGLCEPGCNGETEACVVDVTHALPAPSTPYRCEVPERGRWVFIATGETFDMGSPPNEFGRDDDDEELHDVTLNHSFIIYSSELDQREVGQMLHGRDPSQLVGSLCNEGCPGEHLTWHEAAAATNHMSFETNLPLCYECEVHNGEHQCQLAERWSSPYECPGFRLPTEAEWEFAARASRPEATYVGDFASGDQGCLEEHRLIDEVAWFCGNAEESTHTTGSKLPNDWGLFDMLGNVAEWCHDVYDAEFGDDREVDPWGPSEGTHRVFRGGSWEDDVEALRAAAREGLPPDTRSYIGLRPVRTVR